MVREIIIDQEFKLLLPALDESTYAWLEENILEHGCLQPLVVWGGILIDGYNRYEIVQKHGLPFKTVDMEFDSRDDVTIWIISTQIARRNLTQKQLTYFRGLHYITDKRTHGGDRKSAEEKSKVHDEPLIDTATRLAEVYDVSRATIKRDGQVAAAITAIGRISPAARRDIIAEKIPISRKKLRELSAGPEEEVAFLAAQIDEGTFEKKKPVPSETASVEREFRRLTNDFYLELVNYSVSGDKPGFMAASGLYMNKLEDLFWKI